MLNMQMSGARVTSPVAEALHIIHAAQDIPMHAFVVYLRTTADNYSTYVLIKPFYYIVHCISYSSWKTLPSITVTQNAKRM